MVERHWSEIQISQFKKVFLNSKPDHRDVARQVFPLEWVRHQIKSEKLVFCHIFQLGYRSLCFEGLVKSLIKISRWNEFNTINRTAFYHSVNKQEEIRPNSTKAHTDIPASLACYFLYPAQSNTALRWKAQILKSHPRTYPLVVHFDEFISTQAVVKDSMRHEINARYVSQLNLSRSSASFDQVLCCNLWAMAERTNEISVSRDHPNHSTTCWAAKRLQKEVLL